MNRTDQMNGATVAKEAKNMAEKNYDAALKVGAKLEKSAEAFADQISDRAVEAGKMAKEYTEVLTDYSKRHPWRVGLTCAAVGVLFGAYLMRRK